MKFVERENEILKTMRRLKEENLDFIVVEGYAVSALARHRFSVDCDLVIPHERKTKIEEVLKRDGFAKHVQKAGFDAAYGGEFISYVKKIDLE
jgi:N-dimethylarginine dimethylaminohydrolase